MFLTLAAVPAFAVFYALVMLALVQRLFVVEHIVALGYCLLYSILSVRYSHFGSTDVYLNPR